MILKELKIKNFRNLKEIKLDFSQAINIFLGNNGEGKTNLLEAIYLLGISKSFRASKDTDLINWNENYFVLTGEIFRNDIQNIIEISYIPTQKKVKINEKPLPRMIDLIGYLRVVLFSPDDIYLIKGVPSGRRQFINILISQTSHKYLDALQLYQNILKQRNEILMRLREVSNSSNRDTMRRELDVWTEQLFEKGLYLTKERACAIEKINPLARIIHSNITNEQEKIEITYIPSLKGDLRDELERVQDEEIRRGVTLIGPHRDDIIFSLNGVNARIYSSQGQQKTLAISLRLAEVEYIKQQTNDYPVLLLDDIASELDVSRQEYLFKSIVKGVAENIQTFITTTTLEGFELIKTDAKLFKFVNGDVQYA